MLTLTDPRTGDTTSLDYTYPPAPDPAPPTTPTLFGSSVGRRSGETGAQAWARVNVALGPQITRVYDGGGGLNVALNAAKACGWPTTPSVLSCKYSLADYATGRYDAAFLAAALQLTERDYICLWHEQDAKIAKGEMTLPQFIAVWRYFVTLARQHGVKAKWIQIFTGYKLAERIAQYVGDDWCDAIGIDPYVHAATDTAQSAIGPILATIRKVTAKPVGVCETGSTVANPVGYVASLPWLRGQVAFVCWFNSTDSATTVNYAIDATPAAAAAFRALTAVAA